MRLKVGDLVTCDGPRDRTGVPNNNRVGIVFQADAGNHCPSTPGLIHIHFGTFTFWLLEAEHELNNLKLLSEK